MLYGILLGLSMLVGSLLGKFWIGIGVWLTLSLIAFLLIKYPAYVKTTLKKVGSPKIGGARLKPTASWFWKKKMWVILPVIVLTTLMLILSYQGRNIVSNLTLNGLAAVSGGQVYQYEFSSMEPVQFTAPTSGRWKFEVVDQKEYRYKCPGDKGEGSGWLKQVRWKRTVYERPLNEYPFSGDERHYGALLVYSELSQNNPLPSGEEFIIGADGMFFIAPNFSEAEKRCDVVLPAPVRFILYRAD